MDTMETGTALALPEGKSLEAIFAKEGGIDDLISRLENSVRAEVLDVTTNKGREAVKALAFKVAKSKTAFDKAGKALNDERRTAINAVDAERRKAWDRLEKLQHEVRAPLDAWEAAEEKRVDAHKAALAEFDMVRADALSDVALIRRVIDDVEAHFMGRDWQEYQAEAARLNDACQTKWAADLIAAQTRADEQAELARLRAEAEARAEQDRAAADAKMQADWEAAQAKEAADRATAQTEADKLAAEHAEVKRIADAKAEQERIAQIERDKVRAAERAVEVERERADFAARQAEERHAKELADAKAREEQAAQRERDRLAADVAAEHAARTKREADTTHRDRIKGEIASALRSLKAKDFDAMADAMITGKIPHIKVML